MHFESYQKSRILKRQQILEIKFNEHLCQLSRENGCRKA